MVIHYVKYVDSSFHIANLDICYCGFQSGVCQRKLASTSDTLSRLSVTNKLEYLKGQLYILACKRKILLII